MRILVVDDEPAVRDLTVEILRRSGYKPHGVPTARHALDLLDEEQFDLVVSDVVMPEMTGGSKEPERTTKAVELGAAGLLYKPFSHAELNEAVASVLER